MSATPAVILVVEDDAGLALLQRRRLERAGHVVAVASTADDGFSSALAGVDLVILDQQLPGGETGIDLYRRIRDAGGDASAILVTGFGSQDVVVEALRVGVHDFVPKSPDFLDHLLPAVDRVLHKRRADRDLALARETLIREQAARSTAERAADDLRDADRRKDEFLATLAHELRNPLAPLRHTLERLNLAADSLPPAVAEAHSLMSRQVGHMTRLIDDLLDLSRISRGTIALRRQRLDLRDVVRAAVETSRPLLEAAGHRLGVELPDAPVALDADPVRLAQVFANLLNNAAKYTDAGGEIAIAAASEGGEAVVRVRDTGVGLPPEMLSRVFDMFAQVDTSLERSQGGLGIGLTLVRSLVKLHGGAVEAHSEGIGAGSTFTVRLPPGVGAVDPGGPNTAEADAGRPFRRILVADDNRDSADSLAMLLGEMGYDAQAAHDGMQALAVAETFRPDLVFLDIGMPKLNGHEVCRRLRAESWGAGVRVVALTGWGQDADRQKTREVGFDEHLVKPIDPDDLERILRAGRPA